MITYELAKKLKNAGFPQKGTWENHQGLKYWSDYDGGATRDKPEIIDGSEVNFGFMEDIYYIPTLSELIEACGDQFGSLNKSIENQSDGWIAMNEEQFIALKFSETHKGFHASAPEEAVAKLWLELKKQ